MHDDQKKRHWIPACARMTSKGEEPNIVLAGMTTSKKKSWIPAFAGMT
jgi:hypothetical protein